MTLSAEEQFRISMSAVQRGDMDLLTKVLTQPDAVTVAEQRSVAERLGLQRGFLAAAVNVVSDPTVWVAALMSRVFPTQAWLRGTIPKRFVGTANEFTGLSLAARPVEAMFRGTNVPRLVALKMRREAEVMATGHKIFETFVNRPNWKDEMPIVSLLLEGQSPAGATEELRGVATKIRGGMEEMWGYLKQAKKIRGGFSETETGPAYIEDFLPHEAPKHLRNYLPHMPLLGKESTIEISGKDALKRIMGSPYGQAEAVKGEAASSVWTIDASDQLGADFARYQGYMNSVGHKMNERMFRRMRHGINLESAAGRELFITDLNVVLPKYVHSVARTFANHAPISDYERTLVSSAGIRPPTNDPIVVQLINEGIDTAGFRKSMRSVPGTPHVREYIVPGSGSGPMLIALKSLVRNVNGQNAEDEILFGNLFSGIMGKLDRWKGQLTGKQQSNVDAALTAWERTSSYRDKSNGIASYLYATTLGLNPWSAMQNLMQPALTTIPAIGLGPTIAGYKVLAERLPKYFESFAAEHKAIRGGRKLGVLGDINIALERAFNKNFPELTAQGIRIDPRLFDIDEAMLAREPGMLGRALFKNKDQFYRFALQPFTHTEMSNQVVSFYGARQAILNAAKTGEYALPKGMTGAALEDALNFEAGMVVNSTQFRPGPGSRTVLQSMLPASLRMFTSFPVRSGNFLAESTIRGAMTEAQINQASVFNILAGGESGTLAAQKALSLGTGRNMGTLARMYLYGRVATEGAGQVLNVDLTNSLGITSPFGNVAPDGQPFAPLPLPPVAQILYGTISAASTRDIKRLQPLMLPNGTELPIPRTLVPGGILATRVARAMHQFQPDVGGFVDENERLMYRGNTTDQVLAMLGVPSDKGRRVRDTIEKAQANRQVVRQYRRDFASAAMRYDMEGMHKLQAGWAKAFPDLPALTIGAKDLRRYEANARMPAVQRMLRGMGDAGNLLEADMYEYDPDLLMPPPVAGPSMFAN